MTQRDFSGLMKYTHARGDRPCEGIAFYGDVGILQQRRPLAFVKGGLVERINPERQLICTACGARVTFDDLRPEVASIPHVFIAAERRGRPRGTNLQAIADHSGPVSIGQIMKATGISRRKILDIIAAGEVPSAYRMPGGKKWRIPLRDARELIARLMGDGDHRAA